ncbi:hypothetical protein MOP88_17640 [Sphingomonas sp. WKB10]|nr:hypothetical protein [Sphingomonas sp. WKB10]
MQNYVSNPSDEMLERLFPANEPVPISISLSSAEKIDRSYSILEARMKEALAGRLQPNICVMSADCGTGKSSAVQKVIREEKAKGFTGGGIILFWQR